MAMMCSIQGCKNKHGLCWHEKIMVLLGGGVMVFAVARWGLHAI